MYLIVIMTMSARNKSTFTHTHDSFILRGQYEQLTISLGIFPTGITLPFEFDPFCSHAPGSFCHRMTT